MTKIEKFCFAGAAAIWILVGFGIYSHYNKPAQLGQAIPAVPALFSTSLSIPQATTDTSMTLASATLKNGSSLSGFNCFDVDSNTSLTEYECGTASTTSPGLITGLTRGVDPVNGTSSVASLIFSHRVGASVIVTNAPWASIVGNILNGVLTVPNPLIYDPSVSTTTLANTQQDLASVAYVNSQTGNLPATNITAGIGLLATQSQLQNGTATGTYNSIIYSLLAPGAFFNQTSSATTTVPVTNTSGKLSQGFLDLTQAFTFSGGLTSSGNFIGSSNVTLASTTNTGLLVVNGTSTLASTTVIGNLTVNSATTTFVNLPTSSQTPTFSTQLATKAYVDSIFTFKYLNSTTTTLNTSWSSPTATTTIASISITPAVAARLQVSGILQVRNATTNDRCTLQLYIDNVSQGTIIQTDNAAANVDFPVGFSFITSQVSATTHTLNLTGLSPDSGACSTNAFTQFSALNIGN